MLQRAKLWTDPSWAWMPRGPCSLQETVDHCHIPPLQQSNSDKKKSITQALSDRLGFYKALELSEVSHLHLHTHTRKRDKKRERYTERERLREKEKNRFTFSEAFVLQDRISARNPD